MANTENEKNKAATTKLILFLLEFFVTALIFKKKLTYVSLFFFSVVIYKNTKLACNYFFSWILWYFVRNKNVWKFIKLSLLREYKLKPLPWLLK